MESNDLYAELPCRAMTYMMLRLPQLALLLKMMQQETSKTFKSTLRKDQALWIGGVYVLLVLKEYSITLLRLIVLHRVIAYLGVPKLPFVEEEPLLAATKECG